jgi:hypothetical protein
MLRSLGVTLRRHIGMVRQEGDLVSLDAIAVSGTRLISEPQRS